MSYLSLLVFLDKGFAFQPTVSDGCDDVLMMSIDINTIFGISNVCGIDYYCINVRTTDSQAINLLANADLGVKMNHYKIKLSYIKQE